MAKAARKASKKKAGRKKKATKKKGSSDISVKTASPTTGTVARALAPLEEIEKRFEDLIRRRWPHPFRRDWSQWGDFSGLLEHRGPSVDVVDREKEVLVRAEVPGIDKDDLDVSITDRTLTIKGSSRSEEQEERDDYFCREIRSGTFSRSILLPADVNATKAKANFKDGLVELRLPKVRVAKRHKISVP